MIYFDNAATTLIKPEGVADAVLYAIKNFANPSRGVHKAGVGASMAVYSARCKVADFFNCPSPELVAFTQNATESLNIAICGLVNEGDHVIASDFEHNSVLRPLYRLTKEKNAALDFLPSNVSGELDLDAFSCLVRENTKAVIINHASNVTGNVVNIKKLSEFAKRKNVLLIADVSQTAGHIPVDMQALGIDVLCFTGHKGLLGPQGVGGICLMPNISVKPFKVGGSGIQSYSKAHPSAMPARLEAGTLNTPGIYGLCAGIDFILKTGIDNIQKKEAFLSQYFFDKMSKIEGIKLYGDFSEKSKRTAVVSLNVKDAESGQIADILSEYYNIAVRSGAHCAPRMHKALGTASLGTVRFSFSYFNTVEEIDAAVFALHEIADSI